MAYKNAGRTLLKLLAVTLIAGVLAVVAWSKYRVEEAKNQYMRAMVTADSVWRAQQLYQITNGAFAASIDVLNFKLPAEAAQMVLPGDSGDEIWENEELQIVMRVEQGEPRYISVKIKNAKNETQAEYMRQFKESGSACYAPQKSGVWNKVCQEFGGKQIEANGFWNIYEL